MRATQACAVLFLVALGASPVVVTGAVTPPAEPVSGQRSQLPRVRPLPGGIPAAPLLPPVASIPVAPLGFTPPGALYLGQRNSLVTLDFVDEDRLLFTFRVPGLLRRSALADQPNRDDQRQIRAVVLRLPSGSIETETIWTVHDRARYLWMLKDGHFLLRDGDSVEQGNASLDLKPLLHFPGPVEWLELDPGERFLVSNSREPVAAAAKPGDVDSPSTASAEVTVDGVDSEARQEAKPEIVVRILRRESGQVLLVSRVRSLLHLPINSEGYVEALRTRGIGWTLNLNYFTGGSRILGQVDSTCAPQLDFQTEKQILVTACGLNGERRLVAMSTDGQIVWQDESPATSVWPVVVRSANGERLAEETLVSSHAISAYAPMDQGDIRGQAVRVIDGASGELLMESPASPAFDVGGNVALSPSGRKLAVLNNGALQVFDLPAGAASSSPASGQNVHSTIAQ